MSNFLIAKTKITLILASFLDYIYKSSINILTKKLTELLLKSNFKNFSAEETNRICVFNRPNYFTNNLY